MLRRFSLAVAPRFLWECLTSHHRKLVSSPRHFERSMRISRTTLSCSLHAKVYMPSGIGATFASAGHLSL
jgi:hypothetical protein